MNGPVSRWSRPDPQPFAARHFPRRGPAARPAGRRYLAAASRTHVPVPAGRPASVPVRRGLSEQNPFPGGARPRDTPLSDCVECAAQVNSPANYCRAWCRIRPSMTTARPGAANGAPGTAVIAARRELARNCPARRGDRPWPRPGASWFSAAPRPRGGVLREGGPPRTGRAARRRHRLRRRLPPVGWGVERSARRGPPQARRDVGNCAAGAGGVSPRRGLRRRLCRLGGGSIGTPASGSEEDAGNVGT